MAKWEIIEDNKFKKQTGGKAAATRAVPAKRAAVEAAASPNGLTIKTPFGNVTQADVAKAKALADAKAAYQLMMLDRFYKPNLKSEATVQDNTKVNQPYYERNTVYNPNAAKNPIEYPGIAVQDNTKVNIPVNEGVKIIRDREKEKAQADYDEAYKWTSDYMKSPMYKKMLMESSANTGEFNDINNARWSNFKSIPPLQILPQPADRPGLGGQSWSNTGQIQLFPHGFGTKGSLGHEISHSTDRPSFFKGFFNRIIPQSDKNYIKQSAPTTFKSTPIYNNSTLYYNSLKENDPEGYKEAVDFYTNYVNKDTETRARLNAIRQGAQQNNLYDPFKEGVTPELYYNKLKNFEFEKGDKSGFDPLWQLKNVYSDEEIIYMLNHISENKKENDGTELNNLPIAKNGLAVGERKILQRSQTQQPVQEKSVFKPIPITVKPQYKSEGDYLNQVYGEDSGVQLPGQSSILRASQDAKPYYDVAKQDYASYKKDFSNQIKEEQEQKTAEQVIEFLKANPSPGGLMDKVNYIKNLSPADRQIIENSYVGTEDYEGAKREYLKNLTATANNNPFSKGFWNYGNINQKAQGVGANLYVDKLGIVNDLLNLPYMMGEMTPGLVNIPYNLSEGNYGEAAMGLAGPLSLALLAPEAKGFFGMANSLLNPLAGIVDANTVKNAGKYLTEKTALKNGYKGNTFYGGLDNAIKALDEHISGINQGLSDKRPFFEKFPITNSQKAKVYAAQDKALAEGKQFVQDWYYGKGLDLHPDIVKKMQEINPSFTPSLQDNTSLLKSNGVFQNPFNQTNDILASTRRGILNKENISNYAKEYMLDNRNRIFGVNIPSTNESITLRNRGLYHHSPESIKNTVIHEAGHTAQKLGKVYATPTGHSFVISPFENIQTYDPSFTKYYYANPNTKEGKLFEEAMVKTIPHVKDAQGFITKEGYRWAASPGELHSELLTAREKLTDSYVKHGYDRKEIINQIRGNVSDEQIDWMVKHNNLNRFFKKTTSPELKRKVIRMLYTGIPGAIGIGAASALQQKKHGGIIEDPMGQWAHPGSVTRIPSNQITMQGVNYPVLGVSDRGHTQMMYPGEDYSFRGKSVTEYPMMAGGGEVNFTYAGENHRVYEKVSPTGNGKGVEGHIMVNHPTENKKRWDTIDLTKITNGKVKTVAQGVASTKKWHKENPEYADGGMIKRADGSYSKRGLWDNIRDNAGSGKKPTPEMLKQERKIKSQYANGGKISSWEIIEDTPKMQNAGKAPSSDDSNTTTEVLFDNKTLSTSGDFSPEEIKKIEDYTTKESENRIELIDNYTLLTPEQQKRYNEQKEIASYNDSVAKYEKAKADWEKDKSYFTAPKDGIAFPSNYDDLSSFADYCDPQYGCSGAQGRGSTGIIRNGDHSHKIEYFTKPKLSKELEEKIKARQKQEKIKTTATTTTNTDTEIPTTVVTNTDEKTTPTVIEHSTVNSPDKRYFTGISGSLYRNPRTGAFEHKVYKADGVTGKRLTESYFESDLTNSGSTPVFTADDPAYYSNHPDIYRIRTDSSKTWNPETKKFEAKTWIENKATGESVTDPSFSPVPTTPSESETPPTYTQYGNPSPTVPVSKIKTVQGDYKNGGKILNLGNMKRLPKAGNGLISEITSTLNPKNWGVTNYSDKGSFDSAYSTAKKAGEQEFMFNNKRYNTKYAGTPRQEVGRYGVNGQQINPEIIDQPAKTTLFPSFYNSTAITGRYLPGHIGASVSDGKYITPTVNYSSMGNEVRGVQNAFYKDEKTYYSYGVDPVKFTDKAKSLPLTEKAAKFMQEKSTPSDWNLFTNNCADNVCDAFGIPRNKGLQTPSDAMDKIKEKYPTQDVTGRTYSNYVKLYEGLQNQPNEKILSQANNILGIASSPEIQKSGLSNKLISTIQGVLAEEGYDLSKSLKQKGNYDGVLGDETKKALQDYQSKKTPAPKMAVSLPGQSVALPPQFKKGGKTKKSNWQIIEY